MTKQVTINEFLTKEEIQKARGLKTGKRIAEEIIAPNIERINKALGQENDINYLGYAVEYLLSYEKDKVTI